MVGVASFHHLYIRFSWILGAFQQFLSHICGMCVDLCKIRFRWNIYIYVELWIFFICEVIMVQVYTCVV
ncbi:hypothetical protein L2E82_16412 [Cichorium intybus]|uniref:Uncharacterized protein n=1 Tax=Cichorium intybus TaxID=13427 RepID=A0ACB9F5F9_CICIN|nr:hypothetical protein L2E82_16412 [Cichorium intybus]